MKLKFGIAALAVLAVSAVVAVLAIGVRESMHPATKQTYDGFNSVLVFGRPDSTVIGRGRAVQLAFRGPHGSWTHREAVTATYGLFSDNTMCSQHGRSKCVLTYQRVKSWVVTATGPDECIVGSGGPAPLPGRTPYVRPTLTPDQAATCQMNWVIDARTGKFMEGFN